PSPWPSPARGEGTHIRRAGEIPSLTFSRPQAHAVADHPQQGDIIAVARAARGHFAPQRAPQQVQIADKVKDLVAHQFVRKPQGGVDHALLADQHTVMQTSPVGETHLFKDLDVSEKTKSAGWGDLVPVPYGVAMDIVVLLLADRLRVDQGVVHLYAIGRLDA